MRPPPPPPPPPPHPSFLPAALQPSCHSASSAYNPCSVCLIGAPLSPGSPSPPTVICPTKGLVPGGAGQEPTSHLQHVASAPNAGGIKTSSHQSRMRNIQWSGWRTGIQFSFFCVFFFFLFLLRHTDISRPLIAGTENLERDDSLAAFLSMQIGSPR